MPRANRLSLPALVATLALAAGCLHLRAPEPWRRSVAEAEKSPFGAWVWVKQYNGHINAGELLAADADHVYIASTRSIVQLSLGGIKSITIDDYHNDAGGVTGWALGGMLSTVSHGFFLVATIPMWAITGLLTHLWVANSGAETIDRPGVSDVPRLRMYARYPEGLPAVLRGKSTVSTTPPVGPTQSNRPARRAIPPALAPLCQQPIKRWRQAKNPSRETLLYRDMPEPCKKLITRPASQPE